MATPLACNLRLSDVHAMAETVGREFKGLTDKFGAGCVMGLVPPVVEALERLEVYVESYQKMQTRLCELLMENDTVAYEREQRAKLAVENEELTQTIRQLQRENKRFLLQLDELHSQNEELAEQVRDLQSKDTPAQSEAGAVSGGSPSSSQPSHPALYSPPQSSTPPYSPLHITYTQHVAQDPTPEHPTNSPPLSPNHSPTTPPSPPPTIPPQSHDHVSHTVAPHNRVAHALPPSSSPHPNPHRTSNFPPLLSSPPPSRLRSVSGRSSSLSDVAKYKIHTPMPQEEDEVEDMFERSRVNRRLGVVEGQLDLTTQKLKESQKSLEKIEQENKQLKIRLEEFKAEAALKQIEVSQTRATISQDGPRYYKEEMIRVLTDRNRLKERMVSLQEELDGVREELRKYNAKRIADLGGERAGANVRSILTESICLDDYHML